MVFFILLCFCVFWIAVCVFWLRFWIFFWSRIFGVRRRVRVFIGDLIFAWGVLLFVFIGVRWILVLILVLLRWILILFFLFRSEERRVGKECRFRWLVDYDNKKVNVD